MKKRTHIFNDEVWTFDEAETRKHKKSLEESRERLSEMSIEEIRGMWDELHDRMVKLGGFWIGEI